jgi:hypothetical protein
MFTPKDLINNSNRLFYTLATLVENARNGDLKTLTANQQDTLIKAETLLNMTADRGIVRAISCVDKSTPKQYEVDPALSALAQSTREEADQGDQDAQHKLARMYHCGKGVDQDYKKAVLWAQKAADQGHAEAQLQLAGYYLQGKGVAQDNIEGAQWCQKAAEQGYAKHSTILASCIKRRTKGSTKTTRRRRSGLRKQQNKGMLTRRSTSVSCTWRGKELLKTTRTQRNGFVRQQTELPKATKRQSSLLT